jgi:hypothetical protein
MQTRYAEAIVMKKITICLLLTIVSMFISTQPVHAMLIVDTGEPGIPAPNQGLNTLGLQYLAGRFSASENYTITSVEGFISTEPNAGTTSGTLEAVLYGSAGSVPDVGNKLFSQQFTVTEGPPEFNWFGASGLNWNIAPGTYWLAYEGGGSNTYQGSMPGDVPNPMEIYAYKSPLNSDYNSFGNIFPSNTFGFRIEASDNGTDAIPEPATLILLASGVAGAFIKKRFTV